MDIGVVIKKYRKEAGMMQEEMANRLGVTTPAVNKWENSNSKPDIELLAPIARLLDISLDTLLSFHEKLSDTEIEEIIRKMDRMFSEEGYEKIYEWALRIFLFLHQRVRRSLLLRYACGQPSAFGFEPV